MEYIQDIIDKILHTVETHKIADGQYTRWLWQDQKDSRELGINPYGCADAANILYTLGHFPKEIDERAAWVYAMQAMQDIESGLFHERTHHPLHTTAHVAAALELFDAKPKHRPVAALPYLEADAFARLMENLDWTAPWSESHKGAGVYVILNLCEEATPTWSDAYFQWFWDHADPETGF